MAMQKLSTWVRIFKCFLSYSTELFYYGSENVQIDVSTKRLLDENCVQAKGPAVDRLVTRCVPCVCACVCRCADIYVCMSCVENSNLGASLAGGNKLSIDPS